MEINNSWEKNMCYLCYIDINIKLIVILFKIEKYFVYKIFYKLM